MAAFFDGVQRCRFGVFYFPIRDLSISSSQRHHMHEYPHTPGGQLEKLGRRPYQIRIEPVFDESITLYDRGARGNAMRLYPDVLNNLQKMYEYEVSATLIIPALGGMECFMSSFERKFSAGLLSGEQVHMEFVEDMTEAFVTANIFRSSNVLLPEQAKDLFDAAKALQDYALAKPEEKDLFTQIGDLADDIFSVIDQGELFANQAAGKLQQFSQIVQRADQKLSMLQNPENWQVTEALKDLWSSGQNLLESVTKEDSAPRFYTVPRTMTIQDAAQAIYGTTEKSFDLLQLNTIEDTLAIPAGKQLRYIAA